MKVVIKDYQIIKQASLDFRPGFTVLVGPSNNGKSSIVKAIKSAVYTEPGNTPIRRGSDSYIVGIQSNNHVVAFQKKEGSTKYTVDGKQYSKFGVNTPEEVSSALNIKELILNGNKVQLNFWNQMDKPFLLDKSAGDLFKFILDSGENDQLSSVLKAMVSDRQALNKEADVIQGSIQSSEAAIKSQTSSLEKIKLSIDSANKLIDKKIKVEQFNSIKSILHSLKECNEKINDNESKLLSLNHKINIYSNLNLDLLSDSNNLSILLSKYKSNTDSIYNNINITKNVEIKIKLLEKIDIFRLNQISLNIDEYKNINTKLEDLSEVNLRLSKLIPSNNLIDILSNNFNLSNKIKTVIDLFYSYEDRDMEISNELESIKCNIEKLEKVENLFEFCPLCGNRIEGGKFKCI